MAKCCTRLLSSSPLSLPCPKSESSASLTLIPATQKRLCNSRHRNLGVRSEMSSDNSNSDDKKGYRSSPGRDKPKPNGREFPNGLSSSQDPAPSAEPPSSSRPPSTSADPLWKDVFPTYLQNRESSLPFHKSSSEADLPARADRPLTPSSPSQSFPLSQRGGNSPAYRNSEYPPYNDSGAQYFSPAEVGMPQYLRGSSMRHDPIWAAIRAEAKLEAEQEPILSSFLYASILAHDCFERSLGFVLANRLKNVTLLATQLMDVFDDVLMRPDIREAIRADVQAVRDRDPSCRSYSQALLYYKGYHALQSYRIAHALWNRGQKILALALQSRISEVFAVDIHPAARIGQGILMDHGTGVVIGETAVVGDRVSMLQGVTLGGTGKEAGDRHPKVQEGVLIGAGATILGNISIGKGSMIAAGSLVLKDVPPHSMVAGTPAKIVGTLKEMTPSLTMKHDVTRQYCENFDNIGEGL